MAVALIVAAGRGERLGLGRPKALVTLAGKPMLEWSVETIGGLRGVERIVIALPPEALAAAPAGGLAAPAGGLAVPGGALAVPGGTLAVPGRVLALPGGAVTVPGGTLVVPGGAVRSESVREALRAAGDGDPVIVHDAARPLASAGLFERALAELHDSGADAVIAAAPVSDTIKEVGDDGSRVTRTLERRRLWAVQTPQVFRRAALDRALEQASDELLSAATDDAWLIERTGGVVRVVESDSPNIKVTTGTDLLVAEALLGARRG